MIDIEGKFFELGGVLLAESGLIVREAQIKGEHQISYKADGTEVTQTDLKSEAALIKAIKANLFGVSIWSEEAGKSGDARYQVLADPLDGTRQFRLGLSGSTIIVALYDTEIRRIVACHIVEPSTGRRWSASSSDMTKSWRAGKMVDVRVWSGGLASTSAVFIDNSRAFPSYRSDKPYLSDRMIGHLHNELREMCGTVVTSWSNGLQQAMVANGGEGVAGAITTGIGGPYDVAGAILVLQAGGAAVGLNWDEKRRRPADETVNPLAVMDYDFLVVGNSQSSVDQLVAVFKRASNANPSNTRC